MVLRHHHTASALLLVVATAVSCAHGPPSRDLSHHFTGYRGCFLLENLATGETLRYNPAQCTRRLSPCSTFKILNALIGLETGVVTGPDHVFAWNGEKREIAAWNHDHTLRSAVAVSAVWYFQRLATEVGAVRMRKYLARVGYGNQDISGGLTRFWLGSSLQVSAEEQLAFLKRFIRGQLPFSPQLMAIVKDIMILSRDNGIVLRGKTGSHVEVGRGSLGWFVGWVTRGHRIHVFVTNIEADQGASGRRAREITEAMLRELNLL